MPPRQLSWLRTGIIGINSGAGVAIAVFFLFFPIDAGSFVYLLPAVAFIGALITACFIYFFSYNKKVGLQPVRLVLIGVGFSTALSGAMIVLISSAEREKVDFIAKWLAVMAAQIEYYPPLSPMQQRNM